MKSDTTPPKPLRPGRRLRTLAALLMGVLVSLPWSRGAQAATAHDAAAPTSPELTVTERVQRIRAAIAARPPQDDRPGGLQRLAQWYNWGNWPNFWNNWPNYWFNR